ncbi:hypothetical protein ACOSP7_010253 [Xanthoceras sorbifolium]
MDFLLAVKRRLQVEEFELFSVMAWRCWFRRNRVVHGQLLLPAGDVLAWSSSFLAEFQAAGTRPPTDGAPSRSVSRWSPPSAGTFKLNVNANLADHAGVVGLRLAIRDDIGRVRAARSIKFSTFFSSLLVEATTCCMRFGLQLLRASHI